jgi:hypothetical protein
MKKKKRNNLADETQTLEDPPVTPADVTESLRSLAQIPVKKWSRLARAFIWERLQQEGEPFLKRLASGVTDLKKRRLKRLPTGLLYTFMRQNWHWLCKWHPEAAVVLLEKVGFKMGLAVYKAHRLKAGLKPSLPYTVHKKDLPQVLPQALRNVAR